jgi:hypothetical protein
MVGKILGGADAPRRIMSALADAIRGVSVTPRQRRMAEVVVGAISAQGMVPSKRRAWLAYGDDLVRAIDNGEPFEALLEEGYRNALFESDPRSERSAPPGEGESLDGIVKFRSAGDIRDRLG